MKEHECCGARFLCYHSVHPQSSTSNYSFHEMYEVGGIQRLQLTKKGRNRFISPPDRMFIMFLLLCSLNEYFFTFVKLHIFVKVTASHNVINFSLRGLKEQGHN